MMQIRKGPFGFFVNQKLDDGEVLFDYALEAIQSQNNDTFLQVYWDNKELSYDFSGKISIDEFLSNEPAIKDTSLVLRRKAIGDLFLSVLDNLNILLSPCNICLDTPYVFTDSNGSSLSFCYCPIKNDYSFEFLSGIDTVKLESLLAHRFFAEVLNDDEQDAIIYCIKKNDEDLLRAKAMELKESEVTSKLRVTPLLVIALCLALLSLVSFLFVSSSLSILFFISGVLALVWYLSYERKRSGDRISQTQARKTKQRKQMLFEEETEEGSNEKVDFHFARIEAKHTVDGKAIRYGIYSENVTIGSDQFLSDIFIDDDSIAGLQARITRKEECYYLTAYSETIPTYIDDKRIYLNKEYEIKYGQKLTFGSNSYDFKIGYN